MTDRQGALGVLVSLDAPERQQALDAFYARFKDDPLVVDKWFALQAAAQRADTVDQVLKLSGHPDFVVTNPNRLRSLVGMVLDTVDGKLARCTGASSKWGNVFDHGIDLVHPPFWWWAWLHGLAAYGQPLEPVYATMVLWVIIGGYVAQRVIEGISIQRFGGMEIHVWRQLDSRFRLITARRNPNMVILAAAMLFRRPDTGLVLVAWWTLISLIFHAVRLAQMTERQARGGKITSWLEA